MPSSQIFPGTTTSRRLSAFSDTKKTVSPSSRVLPDLENTLSTTSTTTRRRRTITTTRGETDSRSGSDVHPGSFGLPVMGKRSKITGLFSNFPPVMFLVCKYQEYKRNQQQSSIRKVTERELLRLNHKIEKLLQRLEEHKQPETTSTPGEECVICISAKATMQTFPCGHRVVCRKCFVKTIQVAVSQRMLPLRCVVCRTRILRLNVPGTGTDVPNPATTTATCPGSTSATSGAKRGTGRDSRLSNRRTSHLVVKKCQKATSVAMVSRATPSTGETGGTSLTVRGMGGGVLLSSRSLRSIDEREEEEEDEDDDVPSFPPPSPACDEADSMGHEDLCLLLPTSHSSPSSASFVTRSGSRRLIISNDADQAGDSRVVASSASSSPSAVESVVELSSPSVMTGKSVTSLTVRDSKPKSQMNRFLLPSFFKRLLIRRELLSRF